VLNPLPVLHHGEVSLALSLPRQGVMLIRLRARKRPR
jgi:hypothetical protein